MTTFQFNGIQRLPESGGIDQLFILLHGVGGSPAYMMPLVNKLRETYPSAAFLVPEGTYPFDAGDSGRQWFSISGVTEENRIARVERAIPALHQLVVTEQERFNIATEATILGGFSQGAIMSLEFSVAHDGIAGKVLAFSGRYARLPEAAPTATAIHLFHGQEDKVVLASHSLCALERIEALHGQVTLDLAESVGHQLHPLLINRAIERLDRVNQ
jgi:phospholipase/carboxylesterase